MLIKSLKCYIEEQFDLQDKQYLLMTRNSDEINKFLIDNEKAIKEYAKKNKLELQLNLNKKRDISIVNLS